MNTASVKPLLLTELNELQGSAMEAATAAGQVLLNARKEVLSVDQAYAHDIKLQADRDAESVILNTLKAADPTAEIFSEEAGKIEGSGSHVWYVDPLDGTLNYYHGLHHYCTCIACYQRSTMPENPGVPLFGVVFAPDDDECFDAAAGKGAKCNGVALSCSPVTSLKEAMVTTSYGSRLETMESMSWLIRKLLPRCRKLRIQGSCGLDICNVAAGRISALYQRDIRIWDIAAAGLILKEAGGVFEIEAGARPGTWHVLATAPGIYEELHEMVHPTGASEKCFRLSESLEWVSVTSQV